MRTSTRHAVCTALAFAFSAGAVSAQDASRSVQGGGISVAGWMGVIDPAEAGRGMKLEDARLAMHGEMLHVTTGPAVTYWNPENRATGNYTVRATFTEPAYMNLNDHPHPYGIVIAGSDLGTPQGSFLYCAAYGNGAFIVRGFGPEPFQMNGRREMHDAIRKAAGEGQPVTQEIAMTVKDDVVECAINGTVVGSYPKADVVAAGKLKTTDGIYGIRFGHNTEGTVSGLTMTRN